MFGNMKRFGTLITALATFAAPAVAQVPLGSAITYQGTLQDGGSPANGTYDFRFELYDASTGGTLVVPAEFADDLAVVDGLFTALVDFGSAFGEDARWIEVAVRPGASAGAYTVLKPRQLVTPAPVALYALDGGNWLQSGNNIFNLNSGNVGINEQTPLAKLHLQGLVNLGLTSAHIFNEEDIVVEGGYAWLGLHSYDSGTYGSGVTLAEHDMATGPINTWSIYRRSTGNVGDLNVTFGTDVNPTANTKMLRIEQDGDTLLAPVIGKVGIAESSPEAPLHVYGEVASYDPPTVVRVESRQNPSSFDWRFGLDLSGNSINSRDLNSSGGTTLSINGEYNGDVQLVRGGGEVGINCVPNAKLQVQGETLVSPIAHGLDFEDVVISDDLPWLGLYDADDGNVGGGISFGAITSSTTVDKWAIYRRNSASENDLVITYGTDPNPTSNEKIIQFKTDGTTVVQVLEITGADVAERFPVTDTVEPGMVVEIDPQNPGQLRLASGAYNRRVAGVVSGAGDLPVGAVLGNLPASKDGPPIALSGRVWVHCDATERAVEPGDLLTTADRPGHAMKVEDHARATGATIGKAMTSLEKGRTGLVLVLVNLQ